jgi:hypothetical protein
VAADETAKFEQWSRARRDYEWWKEAHKAAKESFGKDHPLVEWVKAQQADAKAEYQRIVEELSDRKT